MCRANDGNRFSIHFRRRKNEQKTNEKWRYKKTEWKWNFYLKLNQVKNFPAFSDICFYALRNPKSLLRLLHSLYACCFYWFGIKFFFLLLPSRHFIHLLTSSSVSTGSHSTAAAASLFSSSFSLMFTTSWVIDSRSSVIHQEQLRNILFIDSLNFTCHPCCSAHSPASMKGRVDSLLRIFLRPKKRSK